MADFTAQAASTDLLGAGSVSRRAITIGLAAAVLNTVLWGVGRLLGVDFVVVPAGSAPGDAQTVSAGVVIAMTIGAVLLGSGLLAASRGSSGRWWPPLALLGLAVGIVSLVMPLAATASGGTKVFLAAMHLVTGLTWFVQVRRAIAGGRP